MFDILGLEPQDARLTFGYVSALVHPDDVKLYELAAQLFGRPGDVRSTARSACAMRAATGCGCARAASWCSRPTSRACT